MTFEQALSILDQAAAQAPLPRQAHQQVIEALKVIKEQDKVKEPKKK